MSYTDEFHKEAYFGDLYELTIDEAAEKVYSGLWDSGQATINDIKKAIIADIGKGALNLFRGNIYLIGRYNNNPAVLNAFEIAKWAEKNGLELEGNGSWDSYIADEAELSSILIEKLQALRKLKESGKTIQDINNLPEIKNETQDELIAKLFLENQQLKNELSNLSEKEEKQNPKALASSYMLISTMAADGYGYKWKEKKSPVPTEITTAITRLLGVDVGDDTVRKWLKIASEAFPPILE